MKTSLFKFAVLTLSILALATVVAGCNGNESSKSDTLSLKQQNNQIKNWFSKINLGDKKSEVNKVIEDDPVIAEQLDEETLRELYVAQENSLEDVKKRWDETFIATIKRDIPSIQIGFTNNVVTTIIIRTNDNKNVIVQETRHSQDFDNEPEKEHEHEDIDKKSSLFKKYDKVSKELSALWSKDETMSVEDFEKKYGEATFKTETDGRTEMVYLNGSKKIDSIDELNETIKNEARSFLVISGNKSSGTFLADFRHLVSALKKKDGGQTQVTSSSLTINKARDLADREAAIESQKQHSTGN